MVDQALVEKLMALLKKHTEVRAAYLFGSRARGSHRSMSDVDIAVAFAPTTSVWNEVELQEQLTVQLAMPVQVVDLARADAHLAKVVYREGIQLVGDVPVAVEDSTSMGEERPEEAGPDPRVAEALWLLESAADKVRRLDRALPLLTDVVPEAVLAGEMTAVRNFIGVFMLLIEPLETLVRRVAHYAHLMLGYAEPAATLRAQTTLAAQVLGLTARAVEGIGAMARLRGQLAHAYWELDEAAIAPVAPQHLQPVLEHLVERASRFVLVEQVRWQRHG
jgi:predicted nucleotidyltransferase